MEAQGGYDQDRFISTVSRRLVCGICHQVLREPRLCEDGEHSFCLSCISQHLNESQTCPVCRKHLSPETLVHPQSYLRETLGELVIKCDYIERGCPDHIQLGNLQDHVSHCGFAPVTCEKCGMQTNRRDKNNHENSLCQLGAAKCQDCQSMKEELCLLKATLAEIKNTQDEMKTSVDVIEEHQNVVPAQLNEIMNDHEDYRRSMNENQDELKRKHDEMEENLSSMDESLNESERKRNQLEESLNSMNESLNESERKRNQLEESLNSMNESLNESERKRNQLEENLNSMNESLNESEMKRNQLENDVREMKKQFTETFNQVADQPLSNFSSRNKEIIIMGGVDSKEAKKSVIIFNPANGTYAELPPMNSPRSGASSCVYNNDVIVAGGWNGKNLLDSIEILRINQDLPRWRISNGKLPFKLMGHVVKAYEDKLLVIGGWNGDTENLANEIHELALDTPYTPTLLTRMLQPRMFHTAEIVNDKLFILGGKASKDNDDDLHDSVVVFDFITKKFNTFPSLPKPVKLMSTVTWGGKIIVIGGRDKKREDINDVTMYDTESGRSEILPSLKRNRSGHSAVMINDVIFVFGGKNFEQKWLNSVESFKMGSDSWKELPAMKESRRRTTSVVKP